MSTLIDNYPWLLAALEIVLLIALVAYIAWTMRSGARLNGSERSVHGRRDHVPPSKPKRERR